MPYILEVQKIEWNSKSRHIGYMNKVFNTTQDACNYYSKFNPHMPPLNIKNSYCSEWDPITYLMYIVREHFYEYLHIAPFENSNSNSNSNSNNNNSLNY
jgi:hypothetical protein